MATWNVDVQLLWKDEPWPNKCVTMHYKPGNWENFGSSFSEEAYTDEDGHASFEIDDDDDILDADTPIILTVSNHGKYDFGPYTLGGGSFTIDMDPETSQEQISFD